MKNRVQPKGQGCQLWACWRRDNLCWLQLTKWPFSAQPDQTPDRFKSALQPNECVKIYYTAVHSAFTFPHHLCWVCPLPERAAGKRKRKHKNEKQKKEKQRPEYGWVNAKRNHLLKLISQASLNTKWQDIKYVLFMKCLCSEKRVSSAVNYSAIHSEKIISNGKWKQGQTAKELLVSFTLFLNDIGENGKANYGSSKIQS